MMKPFPTLLPSTREERWVFAALSVTAGICEEILFRGFLLFYLQDFFLGLPLAAAVTVSSIVFGMAHLYQGGKGVLGTGVFVLGMALLYVWSGSLLLPMFTTHSWICGSCSYIVPANAGFGDRISLEIPEGTLKPRQPTSTGLDLLSKDFSRRPAV
ncbi:MAG TPA: CPBP family intramembrane glutamic endopeptidase [Rubrobacteraceae bacterium]|nr:CPBP family intramembrane glutamic endopeptidase [Rubrobacteraceae bacterium]